MRNKEYKDIFIGLQKSPNLTMKSKFKIKKDKINWSPIWTQKIKS